MTTLLEQEQYWRWQLEAAKCEADLRLRHVSAAAESARAEAASALTREGRVTEELESLRLELRMQLGDSQERAQYAQESATAAEQAACTFAEERVEQATEIAAEALAAKQEAQARQAQLEGNLCDADKRFGGLLAEERRVSEALVVRFERQIAQSSGEQQRHIERLTEQLREAQMQARAVEDAATAKVQLAEETSQNQIFEMHLHKMQAIEEARAASKARFTDAHRFVSEAQQEARIRVNAVQERAADYVDHAVSRAASSNQLLRERAAYDRNARGLRPYTSPLAIFARPSHGDISALVQMCEQSGVPYVLHQEQPAVLLKAAAFGADVPTFDLPVVEDVGTGVMIGSGSAAALYVGEVCSLAPLGGMETCLSVQYMRDAEDLVTEFIDAAVSVAGLRAFLWGVDESPGRLGKRLRAIDRSISGPFYHGSSPTCADFYLVQCLDHLEALVLNPLRQKAVDPLQSYVRILELTSRIRQLHSYGRAKAMPAHGENSSMASLLFSDLSIEHIINQL